MNARDSIAAFLARIRGLSATDGWLYFLDLLDAFEAHRVELRDVAWPNKFDPLEQATYRMLLLNLDDELRRAILRMPVGKPGEIEESSAFLGGLVSSFTERADAIVERLGGSQLH